MSSHVKDASKNLVEESNEGRNDDKQQRRKDADTEEDKIKGDSEKVSEIVAALEKLERVDLEENEILGKPRSQPSLSHQGEQNAEDTKHPLRKNLHNVVPANSCCQPPELMYRDFSLGKNSSTRYNPPSEDQDNIRIMFCHRIG